MKPTLEDGLRALREATELAKSIRIELTDDYLELIATVEALPQNQPGADKSGRWRGSRAYWRSAWEACDAAGLELWSMNDPLDRPRDRWLADRVVEQRARHWPR